MSKSKDGTYTYSDSYLRGLTKAELIEHYRTPAAYAEYKKLGVFPWEEDQKGERR